MKTYVQIKTSKPMFIAALLVIAKTGYNPNVLQQMNEWMNDRVTKLFSNKKECNVETHNLNGSQGP